MNIKKKTVTKMFIRAANVILVKKASYKCKISGMYFQKVCFIIVSLVTEINVTKLSLCFAVMYLFKIQS